MSQNNTRRVRFVAGSDPEVYLSPGSSSNSSSPGSPAPFPSPSPQMPGAPLLSPTPLPPASPLTVQAEQPLSGHYEHWVQPESSALFASHQQSIDMVVSQTIEESSQLAWDVRVPISNATMQGVRVSSEVLRQEATVPPTRNLLLRIILQSEHVLTIVPSTHGGNVAVGDVLEGVYRFLRQPIPGYILANLDRRTYQSVENAFHRRCENLSAANREAASIIEWSKGHKYVDLLLGRTQWGGVSLVQYGVGKLRLR